MASEDSVETQESASDTADLDQLRQILFGQQALEVASRFEQLEQELAESMQRLNSMIHERFEATSRKMKQEVDTLHESIAACREDTAQKHGEVQQKLASTKNELHQQLGALGNTLAATEQNVRHEMSQGLGSLKDEIRQQIDDINKRMHSEFSRLGDSTVTRNSFRDALRELSSQFDGEDR